MLVRTFSVHCGQSFRGLHCNARLLFKKRCTVEKRAQMLTKLIKNNEKRNHWHLQIGATGSPEKNIYDKIPRPHKRASVLNSLFMESITDVLSTGDVCSEIIGHGIEITGVRITSDYQIVNVFWQIPDIKETCSSDVEIILAKSAPDIRGELIRRNVLGKVPRIYFVRDSTNKRASEFQKCLEASGIGEVKQTPSLPAEELLKNIYKFTEGRGAKPKKNVVEEPEKVKVPPQSPEPMPEKPPDMKLDVMGLNHEQIFNKILAAKKKPKELPEAVLPHVTEDMGQSKHTVSSIQADPLFSNTEREKQIKKFCIDQKTKWAKINKYDDVESVTYEMISDTVDDATEDFDEDYLDEEEEENKNTSHTHV